MKSYGNTGTPITMDMGGFHIQYREPILGGARRSFHKTATLMDAVAEFNTLVHTSMSEGKPFATPLSVERMDIFGNITHRWNLDGRYSVPRLVAEYSGISPTLVSRTDSEYMAKEGRKQRRYVRRNRSRVRRSYA